MGEPLTIRKGRKRGLAPADVAAQIPVHTYPVEAPFAHWEEETRAYCYLIADNTDHGYVCEAGEIAGVSLADWFRAVFATDLGSAPAGVQWISPRAE